MFKIAAISISLLFLVSCAHHGSRHHMGQKKMFEMMDTNKDGAVTKDEFDKAHEGMFAGMDANKDGKVTSEEMADHMKMKKEECKKKGGCKM
ncbi:MAG: hypothetical protein KDD50_12160 [Bdellovibrionales bacterium]|nr:hypothetical protein [Bdellovibrionales bacterium]